LITAVKHFASMNILSYLYPLEHRTNNVGGDRSNFMPYTTDVMPRICAKLSFKSSRHVHIA